MNPLQAEFDHRCALPSDINEHLAMLSRLAFNCDGDVAEFGVRTGNSRVALLHGMLVIEPWPKGHTRTLHSYDVVEHRVDLNGAIWRRAEAEWKFIRADTSRLADIPPVDLLFIDSLHTCEQVQAELKHAHRVNRFIVLHDTVLFGSAGEEGQPGIMQAVLGFLARNQEWRVHCHAANNNGLLVLRRG